MVEARTQPVVKCPIRPADACSLCLPGASGPQDCGLVYLVMSDPDLRERLHDIRSRSLCESARMRTTNAAQVSHSPAREGMGEST